MKMSNQTKLEPLTALQDDAKEREKLLLGLHSGLLGFSGAALLALVATQPHGYLTTAAYCSLTLSVMAFGTVVLGRVHVLHKGTDLHIGHIILAENFSVRVVGLGIVGLIAGFALLVAHISFVCTLFFAICFCVVLRWHLRFKAQLDAMPSAKAVLKATERAHTPTQPDDHV